MNKYVIVLFLLSIVLICPQCEKESTIVYPVLEGPEGSTGNVFSVGQNKKVYFSKGNLQYQASTNTWRFAENQWDVIGENNVNVSPTYAGWIDLFIYGSSGYDGLYPYLIELPDDKIDIGGMNISGTNYDWGQFNPISNGGSQAGLWRVLSKEEMVFLLRRQDSVGNWLEGKGILNLKDGSCEKGLFIMPDNYISEYTSPHNWVVNEDCLCNYGGVFLSDHSGMISLWNDTIRWDESSYMHIGSEGNCDYEDEEVHLNYGCINDALLIRFGQFRLVKNRGLDASVRLVQDYNE